MTGGRHDEPSIEELLASIQRIIAESQIAPVDARDMKPAAVPVLALIDDEPDDFELPAMFRKEKENASAREAGFVERLTQALRAEPAQVPDDAYPAAPAMPAVSSHRAFAKRSGAPHAGGGENALSASVAPERDRGPVSEPLSEAEPVLPSGSGEMRRIMAPCKDTLIARMGQPVDAPSLQVKPRRPAAPASEAEDLY